MTASDGDDAPPSARLADGGLQVERTALAWHRTACSLMIFELVGVRITAELGETALAVLLMALTVPTLVLIVTGVPRSATPGHRLVVGEDGVVHVQTPDGRRPLLLALLVAALGVTCFLAVLVGGPWNPLGGQ
ncbi:DUF202 domain-containing protein [Nocardia higoensis]|uniref:DUF202 domain-containing protein n=1 Tax=Nocardia higoensis TaxID=228599 RepID=UPI0012F6DC44|nr:DUF202 domain-containing protein [Nocardia higoensis]